MRHKLWFKLLIGFITSIIFMFVLLNTYGVNRIQDKLLQEKKTKLYNEATSLSNKYMKSYYNQETTFTEMTYQLQLMDNILNTRIWIVNAEGYIVSDTRPQQNKRQEFNISEIDPDFLNHTFSENTVMPGVLSETSLSVIVPVINNFRTRGYVVLHSPLSEVYKETIFFVDTINIALLIFALILGLCLIYLYFVTIIPLRKIMRAATEYADANYDYKIVLKRQDEFKDLANSLTYMAKEISNLDEYQKKFIANISHDFRSPLTSIKGYARALQDGTIPYEMKDKYLNIILFESERLEKLTTSLLELNNLSNRQVMLNISTFDINQIIKKTAESFEGICKEKKITLKLSLFSAESFVDADQSKIQQVLYNLLDNAIKFSHVNSDIYITTIERGDKVLVSIKDNGIGIAKEDLKKVWDRFFKTDHSRGKDKTGTGLGLAIVKEIVTAHDENINVTSTPGAGTEFIFTLQRTEGFL
ncbi:MAG: HAMP domain-containing histidine kinase [Clostridiales bacterium]|nr:HAMP domain-containing histidine kinase [Clostridiales bacterium]